MRKFKVVKPLSGFFGFDTMFRQELFSPSRGMVVEIVKDNFCFFSFPFEEWDHQAEKVCGVAVSPNAFVGNSP